MSLFQIHKAFTNTSLKSPYSTTGKNLTLVIVTLIDLDLILGATYYKPALCTDFFYCISVPVVRVLVCRFTEVVR